MNQESVRKFRVEGAGVGFETENTLEVRGNSSENLLTDLLKEIKDDLKNNNGFITIENTILNANLLISLKVEEVIK